MRAAGRQLPIHPTFATPPIVELVLSVGFQPLSLTAVQLGDVWRAFADRFPTVEQKAPYQMPLEIPGDATTPPSISLELLPGPPVPRLWFIDARGGQLIQVQADWFARNWRRVGGGDDYPHYPEMSDAFLQDLTTLRDYLESIGHTLRPTQCEVTYIDHIELTGDAELASVLSIVTSSQLQLDVEGQSLSARYILYDEGRPVGRLHVTGNTATRLSDGKAIVVLNFTARGAPLGGGLSGVLAFQDLGREWAWRAFSEFVRKDVQKSWRPTDD